jgi:stage II sporulation protein D
MLVLGSTLPLRGLVERLPEDLDEVRHWLDDPTSLAPEADGEPRLAIGLGSQMPEVLLRSKADLLLDYRGPAPTNRPVQVQLAPGHTLRCRQVGDALELSDQGSPLPAARQVVYVRATGPQGALGVEVEAIEFAKGYAWGGKQRRRYAGDLLMVAHPGGGVDLINHVGAEALLEGVVPAEMPASAPLEALKAQAVAARTILHRQMRTPHGPHSAYTLCAEQHCQVYAGLGAADPRASAAVGQTRGEVLQEAAAAGPAAPRLVDAVYSANCGGFSEDNEVVWGNAANVALRHRGDFPEEPSRPSFWPQSSLTEATAVGFFQQSVPSYCAQSEGPQAARFRWRRRVSGAELGQRTAARWPKLGSLRDLQILGRGPGGRVRALGFVGEHGTAELRFELPIRQFFGNLNSGAFILEKQTDRQGLLQGVTFVGGGWGHGVGMCQTGAMGRARAGQTYRQILTHYYAQAELRRLY